MEHIQERQVALSGDALKVIGTMLGDIPPSGHLNLKQAGQALGIIDQLIGPAGTPDLQAAGDQLFAALFLARTGKAPQSVPLSPHVEFLG